MVTFNKDFYLLKIQIFQITNYYYFLKYKNLKDFLNWHLDALAHVPQIEVFWQCSFFLYHVVVK